MIEKLKKFLNYDDGFLDNEPNLSPSINYDGEKFLISFYFFSWSTWHIKKDYIQLGGLLIGKSLSS